MEYGFDFLEVGNTVDVVHQGLRCLAGVDQLTLVNIRPLKDICHTNFSFRSVTYLLM